MIPARLPNFFHVHCSVQIHVIVRRGGVAGLKPPQLRGEYFTPRTAINHQHMQNKLLSRLIFARLLKKALSALETIVKISMTSLKSVLNVQILFVWSEVGTRDHLFERRREAQLLRWDHFSDSWSGLRVSPPHLVGAGEGILGSCTGKTSAPDEANPAGACLSVHSRSALPSSGSHAHIHPELSWPPRWTQRTNVFIWGTPTTCNTDLKLTLKPITCIDRGLIFLSEDKKGFRQTLRYSQVQHTVTLVNQDYAFQC